ncbi:MAG TPA: DNA helicase, partial [Candidatus Aminicenantes bacterium]|nr:DNA helicase [Candidatus Aminicenantes bacterium]
MEFLISDSFTSSLAKLTGEEQKLVKTTAFDLQMSPESPGHSFHKLDRAKDKHFWSVRVGSDLRIIVHKTEDSLMLSYVDHHDRAYQWAERRKLETHPQTGAAQWVEIRDRVAELGVSKPAEAPTVPVEPPRLFTRYSPEELLRYGVPEEWLADVLVATEDSLLELATHLPAEAAEAILDLAVGKIPPPPPPRIGENPFDHPDAQRRFRIVDNQEELAQALEFPWEKW